ncbi:unnamed protein product, partial [marine sediment metagenome]
MAVSWAITPPTGVETTYKIGASTDKRDISAVLDATYLKDTPFLNKLKWGPPATNTTIEWITDNIGLGYVVLSNGADVITSASDLGIGTSNVGSIAEAIKQLHTGTVLRSVSGSSGIDTGHLVIEHISTTGTITFNFMSAGSTLLSDAGTLFIIGSPVNEGSSPRADTTRDRAVCTNQMQIFRQDVRMTGTRKELAMHGVANDLTYQIKRRAEEYWRELDACVILSKQGP